MEFDRILPGQPFSRDVQEGHIVLTEQDAREAARLLRLLYEAVEHAPDAEIGSDAPHDALVSRARLIFHGRKDRARHFSRAMFGEPAWDIMLLLYISDGGRLTATRIAELVEQPFSTVVRWIDYLEKERFIERKQHPNDKRVFLIRLLDKGRTTMESYLNTLPIPRTDQP